MSWINEIIEKDLKRLNQEKNDPGLPKNVNKSLIDIKDEDIEYEYEENEED